MCRPHRSLHSLSWLQTRTRGSTCSPSLPKHKMMRFSDRKFQARCKEQQVTCPPRARAKDLHDSLGYRRLLSHQQGPHHQEIVRAIVCLVALRRGRAPLQWRESLVPSRSDLIIIELSDSGFFFWHKAHRPMQATGTRKTKNEKCMFMS